MASTHANLDAASVDRKTRLARLAALKRKQPESDAKESGPKEEEHSEDKSVSITSRYLSGRNYDPETRGPKLGFENAPTEGQVTLEEQAAKIAISTAEAAKEDEEVDKPIDLFKLQPKKPNWDLKRDLDAKLKILNVRTENAIARLVRERIQNAQRNAKQKTKAGDMDGEEIGIEGEALLEGMHAREREEEKERRERAEEDLS
ncbi:coiled-coil domain-containing protein, putative [Coccidioides posadasii C735 delta SOWgp]|uniref:Coiled-coil domain-containing protein 12 n=2 Tax=Coccidioides posadasii TaxID=199306 RepID=A0A0J6FH11_COCPO|nr:coiled-coil domain-containing protein, putative [Coccidioides posadasii C735 delta SOWgp]EER28129.1 coiled-coil domain-containing protein, putative [Coccidioides posadasii C735 delta SOWgp]KMM68174.1 hypothetical protein CPAG_04505 [Coccidioides posadasii RMSCC 3488]|eukprot:XP_003070274.1 coiled-coil domain-containing protein, putative [Coccidioides posadasii C735 delta SOWgp]